MVQKTILDEDGEEYHGWYCENCNYIGDPTQGKVYEGSDSDGQRGWVIYYPECPNCGFEMEEV